MVHICGIILIAGRLMYYYGFHYTLVPLAAAGMSATVRSIVADGAGKPVVYAPELVFSCISAIICAFIFPGCIRCVSPRHAFSAPIARLGDWTLMNE